MFRQSTNNSSDDLKLRADRAQIENEINTEHANLVLTRQTDSTIPNSTRDALDRLRAAKTVAAARNANNGGNKRKSKKTNSRKKTRAPTTRRRRVKSIKHKKKRS